MRTESFIHEIERKLTMDANGAANECTAGNETLDQPADHRSLDPEAFHGLAGDVVRAIDPFTEADPVAVLTNTLT